MRITYTDELGITRCRLCRSKRCGRIPALKRSCSYTPCDPAKRDKRSLRCRNQLAPRASRQDREAINRCRRAERRSHVRLSGCTSTVANRAAVMTRRARETARGPRNVTIYRAVLLHRLAAAAIEDSRQRGVRLTRSQRARLREDLLALRRLLRG